MPLTHLLCESVSNPLGIDHLHPAFSWRVESSRPEAGQSAFQILVASSPEMLDQNIGNVWDSQRVESAQSTNVAFAGAPLISRQQCWWKVRVWDETDQITPYSEVASFEMGLLDPQDWVAGWMGRPGHDSNKAVYARCSFLAPACLRRPRLYASALGYYEVFLNGKRLNDALLEPAYTDSRHTVLYKTFDLDGLMLEGENVVAIVAGSGWHGSPRILAQLEGESEGITTVLAATILRGDTPLWFGGNGPVVFNSLFDGETYDARLEKPDWTTASNSALKLDGSNLEWLQLCMMNSPAGRMTAQNIEPIRVVRHITTDKISEPRPGVFVFDFGQNHAGWAELIIDGAKGTTITLKFAESIREDGTVNQDNLRGAAASDTYILKGSGLETWSPQFTYHGYRYVQVEGWPVGRPSPHSLRSCVVRSDLSLRGEFSCSDELLNRIHRLVRWTEESNLHGIPTDCPQRNERMGWLNDLAARSEELIYNFDCHRFLKKFVADITDAQDSFSGAIADTAPFHWGRSPGDPVSVCYLLIPWLLYQHHGETGLMASHREGMRRWVDFLTSQSDGHIVGYSHYGDWAPPIDQAIYIGGEATPLSAHTPGELISTAFYFYAADLFSKMSAVLGHTGDACEYQRLAESIRKAFHDRFWSDGVSGYGSGNQACNSIALYLDLVPTDLRPLVVESLVADVERHDYHLTTGNLCTKYLLEVLSAEGHDDLAHRIATQTTYPSWGYMLANGATTLWERWEHLTGGGMNSHNHPMLGSVGSWLYRRVAGLRLGTPRDGVPHCEIEVPVFTHISHATATLAIATGIASISWRRTDSGIEVDVTIPWNTTATLRLPDSVHQLSAGDHHFVAAIPSDCLVAS